MLAPLTSRECEVLGLLAAGMSNAGIAATLHVTTRTVESHVTQVLHKLGVCSRTQAVVRSLQLGLVTNPTVIDQLSPRS